MPDTLPWEDFAQTNTAVESPPWEDFALPKTKKTKEQVMASIPQGDTTQLSGLEQVANALYWPTRVLSRIDPITAITDALSVGTGGNQFETPAISPEVARQGVEFFTPGIASEGSVGKGVQNFAAGVVSGLTSPKAMAGLVSGKINPVLPAVSFSPQMVSDIPQATQDLSQSQGGQQTTENALRLLANIIFPVMMAKGALSLPQPSGIGYNEIPGPKIQDLPGQTDVLGPERQLGYSATPFPGPRERGLMLPENTYQPPTEVNPVGGASFVVDPAARTLPMGQLSPMEQREAMRGPRTFAPREETVRPSQEGPTILGQDKMPWEVYYEQQQQPLVESVVPNKPPVEPSGGEISFRAPASAEGIPNALQQAQPNVGENYASTIRGNQEEVTQGGYGQEKRGEARGNDIQQLREGTQQAEPTGVSQEARGEVKTLKDEQTGSTLTYWHEAAGEGDTGYSQPHINLDFAKTPEASRKLGGATRLIQQLVEEGNKSKVPIVTIPISDGGLNLVKKAGFKQVGDSPTWVKEPISAYPQLARPSEFTPALKTKEGNVIVGEQGKVHNDIYAAQPGIQGAMLRLQQPEHGFVKGDKFYSREEAAKALDELEPLQSERLRELQKEQGGSIPSQAKGMQTRIKPGQGGEGGSILNPIGALIDKFKNREKELRGDTFALSGPRIAIDPKESGFPNPQKEVDAQQLWNRVKNKLTPAERDIYEKSGIDKAIVGKSKITPEEAGRLMQEGGPQVKVESYGMEGKVSEAERRYDELSHTFYDAQTPVTRTLLDSVWRDHQRADDVEGFRKDLIAHGLTDQQIKQATEYFSLGAQMRKEGNSHSGPRATSAYSQVSALPTTEPMPEWTKSKSGKNVQRVDVVIPNKTVPVEKELITGTKYTKNEPLWQPDNLHENLPNTLGWAMIQYKTGPNGEKIAVIAEAQSRWGQSVREEVADRKRGVEELVARGHGNGSAPYDRERAESMMRLREVEEKGHPLLRDYNRLILKAAIDQARKEGATHIMVSDAETVMMTEGHDRIETWVALDKDGKVLKRYREEPDEDTVLPEGTKMVEQGEPEQEPGMRLNYDTILPKIAEELTGSKGEKVSLGEHKNAFIRPDSHPDHPYTTGREPATKPRENLIFKNPDGTPKTDVSGLMYPLPKAEQKFSLFEKDRPEQVAGRLYMNPVGPIVTQAIRDVKGVSEKLGEYFKGAADKALPALNFDTKSPLPDLQPKDIANKIWSQPFASEKMPILGRMMGGKARIRTPQDEAIATWYAERHGVGPAIASNVGERIRGQITSVFKVSEDGDLNVGRTEGPKQSLKMSDVFEALRKNPSAYKLTPGQAQVFNKIIEPLTKRITQLAQKYDLIDEMVDESGDFKPYFPRIVTEHPKVQPEKGTSAFQKRAFSTEKEGWERGYKYETNPEKRLVSGVERLYRAIANQRLAKDPVLGAKSEAQVKAEIQEAFSEELGSGEMTQAKIDRIAEGIRTKGQVMQPILIRKIFDPEVAKTLNREFAAEQSNVMKAIADTNSLLKATQLGFDLGVGQIQMLPMLYNNPKIWAKAQFKSLQSMASPKFFSEYARQNQGPISELAQMGSSVGRLQEMMAGLGKGQLLSKVPVVGPVGEAFGRQFQTALDVAKVEMWKALRETAPKSEWPKLVRGIETSLLSGRMESAMVPHGRSLLERIALLAPSYYRGAVDSIAGLAEQGASGKVIRNTMSRFIIGGLLTYYAAAKLAGMKDDEIKKRLDPTRSDYLNVAVKQDDGSVVNVGFGGIHRSLLRLAASTVKTSVEHPENWKSLSAEKNPLSRWYRGHAGPTVALTWEGVTGKDFLGRNSDIASMGTRALPLIAQQAIPQKGESPAKPVEYVASALGMTATPESYTSRRNRVESEISQEKKGKEFGELSLGQRKTIEKETNKKLAGVPTGLTEERSQELAMKKSNERLENVRKGLREDTQKWIEEGGVKLRNYETSKTLGKVTVHLTKEETDFLHKHIVEEYQKVFDKLQSNPRISALPSSDKQRYVDINLEHARTKAWNMTRRNVGKLQPGQ